VLEWGRGEERLVGYIYLRSVRMYFDSPNISTDVDARNHGAIRDINDPQ